MPGAAAVLALLGLLAGGARPNGAVLTGGPAPDTALHTIMLPPAMPGAVLTATVEVPVDVRGKGGARFQITTGPRVRLFGDAAGRFTGTVPRYIPLTFILARDEAAGPLLVAAVTITWADQTVYTAELRLLVQPLRRTRLSLSAASTATSSRPLVVHYTVRNLGNAEDTVTLRLTVPGGWLVPQPPGPLLIAPADSATGAFAVKVPRRIPAEGYSIAMLAAGRGDTATDNAFFRVSDENPNSGWVPVPAILFAGIPNVGTGQNRPELAFEAAGAIDPDTRLNLMLRNGMAEVRPPAFYRYGAGPEAYLSIDRRDGRVAVGDLFIPTGMLGVYGFGTGAQLAWRRRTFGDVFLARPRDYGSGMLDGHLGRAALGLASSIGDIGLQVTDFQRPLHEGAPVDRTQGASLTYDSGRRGNQQLAFEGGLVNLVDDSSVAHSGPALDASYGITGQAGFLVARVRRIPAVLPGTAGMNENYLGLGLPIVPGLQVIGWGATGSVPIIGQIPTNRRDAALGLNARFGAVNLQARGNYDRTAAPPSIFGGVSTQRTVSGALAISKSLLDLGATGEYGTIDIDGTRRPFEAVIGRAAVRGSAGAAWIGVDWSEGRFGRLPVRFDAGATATLAGFEFQGGAGAYSSRTNGTYFSHGWAALTVPLLRGSGLIGGVEYRPWMAEGSRMAVSLGLKAALGMPVPVPNRSPAQGRVFVDRNGDGLWEPGEDMLPGVGLMLGNVSATTDERGRFAFPHQLGRRPDLSVNMASLPPGWLVGPFSSTARKADIPMVRAGSLLIRLLSEATEGAPADSAARPVPNIGIDLVDRENRLRSATSDSTGAIRFGALPPGRYILTVHALTVRGDPLRDIVVPVEVPYGERREVVVRVPSNAMPIRFKSGTSPTPHS